MQARITDKLTAALSPSVLEVMNESHNHSVPKGSETHFKVVVVSDAFAGKVQVARHRLIYGVLGEEMTRKPGVHALSIIAKTPAEWAEDESVRGSPLCHSKT